MGGLGGTALSTAVTMPAAGKSACTVHTIYEHVLEQLILADIREKALLAEHDPERLARQIVQLKEKESRTRLSSYEQELRTVTARISELEHLMQNLYEDKCTGTIPQTVFQTLMRKYEAERAEKTEQLPELERKVKDHMGSRQDAQPVDRTDPTLHRDHRAG